MLKAIGLWITDLGDEQRPAPQELVGEMPAQDRGRLAAYLDAGMRYELYLGYSWCRIGCGIDRKRMGSWSLSDGTWVWPEGLSHYVRKHRLLLPEDFVHDALSKSTPVIAGWAENNGPTSQHKTPTDEAYWHSWCSTRRASEFLDQLRARRLAAEALAAAESDANSKERIAGLERDRGITDSKCIWNGCPRKSLIGGYICAEHSIQKDPDPQKRLSAEFGKVLGELNKVTDLLPAPPSQRLDNGILGRMARMTRLFRASE